MILGGNVFPDVRENLDVSRLKTRRKENQYLIIKCTFLIGTAAIAAESRYLQTLDPYKVMWDLQAGPCGKIPERSDGQNVKERKSFLQKMKQLRKQVFDATPTENSFLLFKDSISLLYLYPQMI